MAVRPLRDGRYVVETEGGTYVVDAEAGTCTCPDSAIRDARCKHLRRVDLEIESGEVPPPGERASACAVCGERVFVPMTADGPHLCPRHDLSPGDLAVDRESGKPLLVVAATGRRADRVRTDDGTPIAEYPTNENYGAHEPVFEAVYLDAFERVDDLEVVDGEKRYGFPASPLRRVDRDEWRPRPRAGRSAASAQGGAHADSRERPERDGADHPTGHRHRDHGTRQQTLSESAGAAA